MTESHVPRTIATTLEVDPLETNWNVIPPRLLFVLVVGLPILVVAFAVLMAGSLLAEALADPPAVRILRGVAIGDLLLLVIDGSLVLGALGFRAIEADARQRQGDDDTREKS